MDEWGIDLSREFPKPLTDETVRAADVVVTGGCGDAYPLWFRPYLEPLCAGHGVSLGY